MTADEAMIRVEKFVQEQGEGFNDGPSGKDHAFLLFALLAVAADELIVLEGTECALKHASEVLTNRINQYKEYNNKVKAS